MMEIIIDVCCLQFQTEPETVWALTMAYVGPIFKGLSRDVGEVYRDKYNRGYMHRLRKP